MRFVLHSAFAPALLCALSGGLTACEPPPPGAGAEAGLPPAQSDAQPPPPAPEARPLFTWPQGAELWLEDDELGLRLVRVGQRDLQLSFALRLADVAIGPESFSAIAWQTDAQKISARFSGHPLLPTLRWQLLPLPSGLQITLTAVDAPQALPLQSVEPVHLAWTPDDLDQHLPETPGPWRPATQAARRLGHQDLRWGEALVRVESPLGAVESGPGAAWAILEETATLAPGAQLSAQALLSWHSTWRAASSPSTAQAPPLVWASRPAYGDAINAALLRAAAEALAHHFGDLPGERALLAEGLWYAEPGQAQVQPPVAEHLDALVEAAAPAQLWLRWPARHAPAALPLWTQWPAAQSPDDARCGAPDCARLDPQQVAAQAHTARVAAELSAAGVAAVWLDDTRDLSAATTLAWVDALRDAAPQLDVRRDDGPSLTRVGGALWPLSPAPLAPPCEAATHHWPLSEACRAHLAQPVAIPVDPPEPAQLEQLAFALVADASGEFHRAAPPALAWRGLSAERARQAAVLALVSGGPVLLADPLGDWAAPSPGFDALKAALSAGLGAGQPLEAGDERPPQRFAGEGYVAFINWSGEAAQWSFAHDVEQFLTQSGAGSQAAPPQIVEVFSGQTLSAPPATLSVGPHDAQLWMRAP